jgi:hypothetical protein
VQRSCLQLPNAGHGSEIPEPEQDQGKIKAALQETTACYQIKASN